MKAEITSTQYHMESLHLLKGYRPAVEILGEPIEIDSISEDDPFNIKEDKNIQVTWISSELRKQIVRIKEI